MLSYVYFFLQIYYLYILIDGYFCYIMFKRVFLAFGAMLRGYDKATSEELRQLRQVPNLLKFVVVFKGDECVYWKGI